MDFYNAIDATSSMVDEDMLKTLKLVESYFDYSFYLSNYSGVLGKDFNPVLHYVQFGWKDGLDPNPGFSVSDYLNENQDVADSGVEPFGHYLIFGRKENRRILPSKLVKNNNNEHSVKTAVITMVKNEKDIIREFCSSCSVFFDKVIIIDHMSTDGTYEYLKLLEKRFKQFKVYRFDEASYCQAELINFAAKNLLDVCVDWLFFLDADEFLSFADKTSFISFLQSNDDKEVLHGSWVNLIRTDYSEKFDLANQFFIPPQKSEFKKVAVHLNFLQEYDFFITQGNHTVEKWKDGETFCGEPNFFLLHIPVRSKNQMILKLSQGVLSYTAKIDNKDEQGSHWKNDFEYIRNNPITNELLNYLAYNYGVVKTISNFEAIDHDYLIARGYKKNYISVALNLELPEFNSDINELDLLFNVLSSEHVKSSSKTFSHDGSVALGLFPGNVIKFVENKNVFEYAQLPNVIQSQEVSIQNNGIETVLDAFCDIFWDIENLMPTVWGEHIPFMFFLITLLRPRRFVELGTHHGASFFAVCQAKKRLKLDLECIAIDTWKGDAHIGQYSEQIFNDFKYILSRDYKGGKYLRMTFNDAIGKFEDRSIDLLHIDGGHTFENVTEDFSNWLPKMSNVGVVLFHDINEHANDFGVWRLWEKVKVKYPSFEFYHAHGLGVLYVGTENNLFRELLCFFNSHNNLTQVVQNLFSNYGEKLISHSLFNNLKGAHGLDINAKMYRMEAEIAKLAKSEEECVRLRLENETLKRGFFEKLGQ